MEIRELSLSLIHICHFLRKKNLPQDTDDYMDLEKIDADSGRFIRQK